jgi:hypothetical protein
MATRLTIEVNGLRHGVTADADTPLLYSQRPCGDRQRVLRRNGRASLPVPDDNRIRPRGVVRKGLTRSRFNLTQMKAAGVMMAGGPAEPWSFPGRRCLARCGPVRTRPGTRNDAVQGSRSGSQGGATDSEQQARSTLSRG